MMKEQDATEDGSSAKDTSKLAEPSHHNNGRSSNVQVGLDNAAYEEEDRTAMNDIPPLTDNKNGVELVNLNVQPGKTNGSEFTHYYLPVNTHKKLLRGEKLYVTRDPRARGVSRRKVLICAIIWFLIVVVFIVAVLAAMGIIFSSPKSSTETVNKSTLLTVGTDVPTVVVNPEDSTFNGIASPQTLQLQFTITNLLFDHNLHDENSLHFQSLQRRLENELYQLFLPNLWKVVINKFSEGSVIVSGLLYSSADQQPVTDQEMLDHFTEALKKSNSYLGPYTISLSSISITDVSQPQTKESRPSDFGRGMSGDWSTVTEFTTTTDLWSILAGWTTEKVLTTQEETSLSTMHLHQFETETTTIAHETTAIAHETTWSDSSESETSPRVEHIPETTSEAEYTPEATSEAEHTPEATSEPEHTPEVTSEATSEVEHTPEEIPKTLDGSEETTNATITGSETLETNGTSIEDEFTANVTISTIFGITESTVLPESESTVSHENATDSRVNITSTEFIIPPLFTSHEVTNATNETETGTDFVVPSLFTADGVSTNFTDDTTDFRVPPSFVTAKDNTTDDSFISPFVPTNETTNGSDNSTELNTTEDSFISPLVNVSQVTNTTKESENSTESVFTPFATIEKLLNETFTTFGNESTPVLVNATTSDNVTTDDISTSDETGLERNLNSTLNSTKVYDNSTPINITDVTEENTTLTEFATDNSTMATNLSSNADTQSEVSNDTSVLNLGVTEANVSTSKSTSNATVTDINSENETDIETSSPTSSEVDYANQNTEESSTTSSNVTEFDVSTQNSNGEMDYANKNSETIETTTTTNNNDSTETEDRQNNVTKRVDETSTSGSNETAADAAITHKHDSISETSALHHNEIDIGTSESATKLIDNFSTRTTTSGIEENAQEVTYSSNDRRR